MEEAGDVVSGRRRRRQEAHVGDALVERPAAPGRDHARRQVPRRVDPQWNFAPFTRGFFEHGEASSGPPRRQVLCYVAGTLHDLVLIGIALLRPPWQVHSASDRHAILGYGDHDLWLSLNVIDDGVDLRVASHLGVEATVRSRSAPS